MFQSFFRLLVVGFWFFFMDIASGQNVAPRAWQANLNNSTITILGESHLGRPSERDGYFKETVLPFFREADVLVLEWRLGPARSSGVGGKCEDEHRLLPGGFLEREVAALLKKITGSPQVSMQMAQYQFLNAFLPLGIAYYSMKKDLYAGSEFEVDPLLGYLRGDTPIEWLETVETRWRAFCDAPKSVRIGFMDEELRYLDYRWDMASKGLLNEDREVSAAQLNFWRLLECVDKTPHCSGVDKGLSPRELAILRRSGLPYGWARPNADFVILRNRNISMAERIVELAGQYRNIAVVVGAAHLPTFSYGSFVSMGLLDNLRASGAVVSPVLEAR